MVEDGRDFTPVVIDLSTRENETVADRYLFIRLSALGDVVCTLPALAAVRAARPDCTIDWVVEDRFADLLGLVEGIENCLVYPRTQLSRPSLKGLRSLRGHHVDLRREQYDAAVDFQGNLKGAAHLLDVRSTLRIGLDRESSREGSHHAADVQIDVPEGCHRVERALLLTTPLGVSSWRLRSGAIPEELRPVIRDEPAAAEAVEQLLSPLGDRPRILLHPGTSKFGALKRWDPARFGEVARNLSGSGSTILVTSGPDEDELSRRVLESAGENVALIRPTHGIPGLVALLRRVDLVIAADSGPLMLASMLGTRTVALFGPKDPAVYAPPFANCSVIRKSVPCSPCSLRECEDTICMKGIGTDIVVEAARQAIG